MTTYGDFPGVRVDTSGGGITGIEIGAEEKVVLFGNGDPSAGTASVNSAEQIGARREADTKFGEDTELANAMKEALSNGANISYLYGVMLDETSVTAETFAGTSSDSLANAPIVEDLSVITVTDTVDTTEATVEFKYESPPSAPSNADTVFLNPLTGEWTADSSSDYEFDYDYPDWSAAFDAADNVVNENETGVYFALSEAETVANSLDGKTTTLRNDYQLVSGFSGAQPNTTSSDNDAHFDTSNYSDAVDSDTHFLFAPVRQDGVTDTVLGGVAGLFGGNAIDDPIYNEAVSGYTELEQKLSKSEADNLRDEEVIPIRQAGSIRVKDNLSTSTSTDWERDFWRRRIVDRVILVAKQVGDRTVGRINDEQTQNAAERLIRAELESMANDRLIKPNTPEENNWFVDVYESTTNTDQINIDIGITPYGIVKQVDASVTINT